MVIRLSNFLSLFTVRQSRVSCLSAVLVLRSLHRIDVDSSVDVVGLSK